MSRKLGAVTPMAASRDLETIRRAAKLACKLVAEIGERAAGSDYKKARKLLESLRSRARSAPQLLSTWGAASFLIFYASKAVEADPEALKYIAQKTLCADCTVDGCPRKIDDTALGYAIYLAALLAYHHETEPELQLCLETMAAQCSFPLLVDKLIEHYLESRRQYHLLYVVEHLSRLITVYSEPVLNEANTTRNNGLVVEKCHLLGGET